GVEHRFIEERNGGVEGESDVLIRIAGAARVLLGGGEYLPDVTAEGVGVGGNLPVGAQPHGGGERFLQRQRQRAAPQRRRGTGLRRGRCDRRWCECHEIIPGSP